MSETTGKFLRGGARALTGVLIVGVTATGAVLVGATPLPTIEREPIAIAADAQHGAERPFVCAGSFAELGADASRPSAAIPTGRASVTSAGEVDSFAELERGEPGGSAPEVLLVEPGQAFAAAQFQKVVTDSLSGIVASSCAEPSNEQWLVGGSTDVGVSTTINLGNPAPVPATVSLTVYDENGRIDSSATSGVLVPARSERVVSLNGYAPRRVQPVVRVESTGAAVTASLGIGHVSGLTPLAVDTVTRQLTGKTTLVVPGVMNVGHEHGGPTDVGDHDEFPVVIRALSTTGESGTVTARAVSSDGRSEDLGVLALEGDAVHEMQVEEWPESAHAVILDSTVPIVAGILGQAADDTSHDYAWFAPAPPLPADTEVAAAVVEGGQLILVNNGSVDAVVSVSGEGSQSQEYTVSAGAALAVLAPEDARLRASHEVHAAVRIASSDTMAGYPILAESERASEITVFTR